LWRRHWSAARCAVRFHGIPEELASGGVISRRRNLGIFLLQPTATCRRHVENVASFVDEFSRGPWISGLSGVLPAN
jgi:hypothetical protein